MGKPKAPTPPDPAQTASAQTAQNIGTAIAQQQLINTNQITPYGNLTYNQTGTYTYDDPLTDRSYDVPQYTATQTLSPEGERIVSANLTATENLANLGASQSARLEGLLSRPLDTSTLPAAGDPSAIRGAQIQTQAPGRAGFVFPGQGPTLANAAAGPTLQRAGDGPALNGTLDTPALNGSIANAGDVTRTYGTDFSADRARVEDALFQRLSPQLEQDRRRLEQRLSDQGIQVGSKAYQSAMDDYGRQTTDARLATIAAGGQEQSRLAALEAARAGFENSAQAQAFNQNLTGAQFGNQTAQQIADNQARAVQFGNQTAQQTADNSLARLQLNNQYAQQAADNALQRTGFNNSVAQQAADNDLARNQYTNSLLQLQGDNALTAAQFANQAGQQQQNADAAIFDAQNQARNQALQQSFAVRNQPLNELSAILSGTQVQSPAFVNTNAAQLANTDYAGLVQQNYANQLGAYNQQVAQRGQLFGGLLGLGGSVASAAIPFLL